MDSIGEMFDLGSNSFWNLLLAGLVVGVSLLVARYARRVVRRKLLDYEGVDKYAGALLGRIAGWAIVFFGVGLALVVLGVDMVAVVLGLALVAAFLVLSGKSLIENWAAGLLLQARAPYRPGDRIQTLNYVGDVELTNVRSVVLRKSDGQVIHIPNIDVLNNPMVNQTGDDSGRRSSLDFGVAYGTDLHQAERILTEAAASIPGVREEPAPSAWIAALGESSVVLELRFWTSYAARNTVRSSVAHEALASLDDAGVSMPFPIQQLMITSEIDGPSDPSIRSEQS